MAGETRMTAEELAVLLGRALAEHVIAVSNSEGPADAFREVTDYARRVADLSEAYAGVTTSTEGMTRQ